MAGGKEGECMGASLIEGAAVVDVAMVWRSEYACSMGMVGGVPIGTDLWLDSL